MDNERLSIYLRSLEPEPTPLIAEIEAHAAREQVPIIRKETASLLQTLIVMNQPKRILEVGAATGYSALCMSVCMPEDAHLTTIEKYEKRIPVAKENFRRAGMEEKITLMEGDAADILKELTKYPVATRLSLNGTIIVGRDIAHAKLKERLDRGEDLPQYIKDHPIYYAGPAKTPAGMACGSMGPTTAGRMDPYVDLFQSHGGSMIMLAKGNRSQQVTDACKKYGGFYLGSIGGPAAILAQNNIKSIECVEYPELGMEAIWKIEVEDFPAFILVDDKGNDFFKQIKPRCGSCSNK